MARRRKHAGWVMSLNLTPMIDTVFNLLFFFMIASRFGVLEGLLPARLPARSAANAAAVSTDIPRTPLRIEFVSDPASPQACRVRVAPLIASPIAIGSLVAELTRVCENQPGFDKDTPVYLLATDDLAWNHVVNAYNAALSAGYTKIFFSGAQ